MSEILFISDLHLDAAYPQVLSLALHFFKTRALQAEALYILGDLFEVWVGDDHDDLAYRAVIKALQTLTTRGIPVFVMHGNRDFLLGEAFLAQTGCQLLPDPSIVNLYNVPTLLLHGDSLCTLDTDYQLFRRQVRNPSWQQQFLNQPLAQRLMIAQQARHQSKAHTRTLAETITDVTSDSVIAAFSEHHVYRLIHGHTHRPTIHTVHLNGHIAYRYVLGDWHEEGAMIISCTPTTCQLIHFTIA